MGISGPPRRSHQDRDRAVISRFSLWTVPVPSPVMRATLPMPRPLASSWRAPSRPHQCPRSSFRNRYRQRRWLRFRSPYDRVDDVVTARVHEPNGTVNPPTIIFGHGVCVDFDHWLGLIDESIRLVSLGFRVIRPEAPWHGRRSPRGFFAGERTISAFPMGIIDSMMAAVTEWSVLAHWARTRSNGPLAFGGSSLGAMTAQLVAGRAATGPRALKPDALFLVTHTADMTAVCSTACCRRCGRVPSRHWRSGGPQIWRASTCRCSTHRQHVPSTRSTLSRLSGGGIRCCPSKAVGVCLLNGVCPRPISSSGTAAISLCPPP
jgi:hypothetical protein